MALTIVLATVLGLLGLLGLVRGVRRGLVALGGTLLAAVLIDLWQTPIASWVRESLRPEQPGLPTFVIVTGVFLLVALLVGYGGSALLPKIEPKARPAGVVDRPLGALLGALNGALITSYVLRFADDLWRGNEESALTASPVAQVLNAWLPWFILTMVATTMLFVLLRVVGGVLRTRATANAATRAAAANQTASTASATRANQPAPNAAQPAQTANPPPPPRTVAEQDRRVLDKIKEKS